jgi:2-(1,2-epoxy-1,2-dihydrophenyl)acetyl-CoA isomerase
VEALFSGSVTSRPLNQEKMMNLSTMTYRVEDRVAHVRFSRPEAANSVTPEFARDLRQVMLAVEFDDDVRAASVTAEGKVFCAGGDLKKFHAAGDQVAHLAADMLVDFHAAIYKMNRIPKPFVAGVRGAAGGAGLSLMSAFDLVVSSDRAKYTMAYTKAGVTPDGTSSYFLARHVGLRRMLDLTLTNRVLSADEAEQWGLVNRVVADEDVDDTTAELAGRLAAGAWAVGAAKRVIYEGFESPLEQAGEFEEQMITQAMRGPDGLEGIAAFAEKRTPEFRGR